MSPEPDLQEEGDSKDREDTYSMWVFAAGGLASLGAPLISDRYPGPFTNSMNSMLLWVSLFCVGVPLFVLAFSGDRRRLAFPAASAIVLGALVAIVWVDWSRVGWGVFSGMGVYLAIFVGRVIALRSG
jgi:hypothetical protein